jgi:hypothetical protein
MGARGTAMWVGAAVAIWVARAPPRRPLLRLLASLQTRARYTRGCFVAGAPRAAPCRPIPLPPSSACSTCPSRTWRCGRSPHWAASWRPPWRSSARRRSGWWHRRWGGAGEERRAGVQGTGLAWPCCRHQRHCHLKRLPAPPPPQGTTQGHEAKVRRAAARAASAAGHAAEADSAREPARPTHMRLARPPFPAHVGAPCACLCVLARWRHSGAPWRG